MIALRGGRGNAVRVAGTGEQSYEASGIIASGSVALTSSLSFPSAIAVDGSGAPVFINGYAPGCVLRLAPTGVLEVLVGLAMATGRDIADGPLSVATAFSLTALAVVNGASALLLADSSLRDPWSVVRRVDLASANISRIAGSFSGSENDGQSLLDTQFSYIRAIAQYSGENLALVEHYKGRVRIGVTSANTVSVLSVLSRISSVSSSHPRASSRSFSAPRDIRVRAGHSCRARTRRSIVRPDTSRQYAFLGAALQPRHCRPVLPPRCCTLQKPLAPSDRIALAVFASRASLGRLGLTTFSPALEAARCVPLARSLQRADPLGLNRVCRAPLAHSRMSAGLRSVSLARSLQRTARVVTIRALRAFLAAALSSPRKSPESPLRSPVPAYALI